MSWVPLHCAPIGASRCLIGVLRQQVLPDMLPMVMNYLAGSGHDSGEAKQVDWFVALHDRNRFEKVYLVNGPDVYVMVMEVTLPIMLTLTEPFVFPQTIFPVIVILLVLLTVTACSAATDGVAEMVAAGDVVTIALSTHAPVQDWEHGRLALMSKIEKVGLVIAGLKVKVTVVLVVVFPQL